MADDGVPVLPLPALADASDPAAEALATAAAALEGPTALEAPAVAETLDAAQVPTATAPEPAEPADEEQAPAADAEPEPEPAPDPAVLPLPDVPEPAAAAAPAVEQVAPVNVNVSIRIDSPGDNGAVTQVNEAAATTAPSVAATPAADTQYQAPEPQYQEAAASDPTPPQAEAAPTPTAPAESWEWNWSWDCAEGAAPAVTPPAGSVPQNWTWNWNWNCGGAGGGGGNSGAQLPTQYQGGVAQYQPINVNISIRINSPGSDGPVVQTNVAIGVALPPLVARSPAPHATTPRATESASAVATAEPAAAEAPAPLVLVGGMIFDLGLARGDALLTSFCSVAGTLAPQLACAVVRRPAARLPLVAPERSSAPLAQYVLAVRRSAARRDLAGGTPGSARIDATAGLVATLAAPRPAAAAAGHARSQERRLPTHAGPTDLTRQQLLALGVVGAGPAGSADRNPFIVFAFLGAFVFAFVGAARRVRDERSAAAAEPGRRRERPG